jgi:hypothetical protein
VPSLDNWEKGWGEKLKAEMSMLKLLPADFRPPLVLLAQANKRRAGEAANYDHGHVLA